MARPARNEMAATELGNRLAALQAAHPDSPTAREIEVWLIRRFDVTVSAASIRNVRPVSQAQLRKAMAGRTYRPKEKAA